MANVINKATNKFTKGLVLDFSPENTGNEVLTHALNATLLTFNGNELSLQNDMGNARVETAFLPEGYIPVGTCEYGGIIYIVSYNPLEDKSLIGCFPSPERNISSDELGIPTLIISNSDFVDSDGNIENVSKYVLLKNDKLNPGDKFIINANESIYEENLKDLFVKTKSTKTSDNTPEFISTYNEVNNPVIALNIVSIEDSGKIIYLNSTTRKYEKTYKNSDYIYHILGTDLSSSDTILNDIDEYRNVLSSGYSIFKSKTSGKLAILAELIMIDSYSVTHSIEPKQDANGNDIPNEYDIIIHTEAFSEETNYRIAPKLKYYYLTKSFGKLYTHIDSDPISLFNDNGDYNDLFFDTKLSMIYLTKDTDLQKLLENTKLKDVATFDFPKPKTYHERLDLYTEPIDENLPDNVFTKFYANSNHLVEIFQLSDKLLNYCEEHKAKYYTTGNAFIENITNFISENNDNTQLFIVFPFDVIIPSDIFTPDPITNSIKGYDSIVRGNPVSLYIASDSFFLANSDLTYNSVKLASIKLPEINNKGLEQFPFKYEYTLIPCMNYGKLEHLAVSNKIDFSKIFNFNDSNFNIWKYRIDSDLLRLTFGAEIYDTNSNKKVIGLILEFYDHRGFAGSFLITDKKSYSGVFTKIISLNSLNALSNYQVIDNAYKKNNYKRNAAIIETKDESGNNVFKLNDKIVEYIDSEKGWEYESQYINGGDIDGSESPDLTKSVSEESYVGIIPNDCGTLYSNFLYGVKAYFKIKDENNNVSYEEKEQFFLYTFPFYNEKYYNCDNFNTLPGPTLDMVLTYKLDDLGTKSEYTGFNIENGYNTEKDDGNGIDSDKNYVEKYFNGEDLIKGDKIITDLNIIKYYKYEGPSYLYLEVGLKKDYENYSLGCLPEINDCFSCDLQLISNDESNKQLTVTGGEYEGLKLEDILNYNYIEEKDLNKIFFGFASFNTKIQLDSLNGMNFLNRVQFNAIPINYNFVVGYKINISGIRKSEVPATTVCALFHKKPNGKYNYEDFGMVELEGVVYNKNIIYTGGSFNKTIIGIAEQKNSKQNTNVYPDPDSDDNPDNFYGDTNNRILNFYSKGSNNTPSQMFNSATLKNLATSLGKLVFCPPHYNYGDGGSGSGKWIGPSLRNQVNLDTSTTSDDGKNYWNHGYVFIANADFDYRINPGSDNMEEGTGLISGGGRMWYFPIFNTCLVTQKFGELYSEFIPMWYTNGYKTIEIPIVSRYLHGGGHHKEILTQNYCYSYLGFTNTKLLSFNKYLLNTMKNVYAYNPDYDSRLVNIGEVSTQTYNPQFISNLICTDSEFKFNSKSLNDYVTINSFIFSTYLNDLEKYSHIELNNNQNELKLQIQLNPGYTYCGKEGNPYLITTLTYNTPVPEELKYEFEYISANTITIKKENGSIELLKGNLENDKVLFGYKNNKLILLDVENYTIDQYGLLVIKDNDYKNTINYVDLTPWGNYSRFDPYNYTYELGNNSKNSCFVGTTITINDLLYNPYSDHRLFVKSEHFLLTEKRIFYRKIRNAKDDDYDSNDYCPKDTRSSIQLYIGPCFTNDIW